MTTAFQAPPGDLKILSHFLQRAHETKTADPALSYWCNYHAAQIGIPLASQLSPSSKEFLFTLLDTLEAQKKSLSDNEIVNGDELVAKAYVENVALKVFALADNQDRSGKASKATARHFLVASNFIEVLNNFGPLDTGMEGRLRYSKWKATEIAKALREGREPTPGGFGETVDAENEDDALNGTQRAADRLAGLSSAHPQEEDEYIEREMAKLRAADTASQAATAISTIDTEVVETPSRPTSIYREHSRLSYDGKTQQGADDSAYMRGASSPNFSRPLSSSISASPSLPPNGGILPPSQSHDSATSPSPRPLPMPPSTSSNFRREGLPMPPGGQGSINPLVPPAHLLTPSSSSTHIPQSTSATYLPSLSSQPSIPSWTQPSAPSVPSPIQQPSAPTATSALPSSLDHLSSARVQKLAKWAVSALDYEDVETARKHLKEALEICEGKIHVGK